MYFHHIFPEMSASMHAQPAERQISPRTGFQTSPTGREKPRNWQLQVSDEAAFVAEPHRTETYDSWRWTLKAATAGPERAKPLPAIFCRRAAPAAPWAANITDEQRDKRRDEQKTRQQISFLRELSLSRARSLDNSTPLCALIWRR